STALTTRPTDFPPPLRIARQAGACFRESLIVESDYQTTSECSFWKQTASRGRSSHGRHFRNYYGNNLDLPGSGIRTAGCLLALRHWHQPSPKTIGRAFFPRSTVE